MRAKRLSLGLITVGALVLAVVIPLSVSSAGAQTPGAPTLVSATILANNYKMGERSIVQFTFSKKVTLPNGDSGVGTLLVDNSPADLAKFSLASGTHPIAASIEENGFIVEADFPPSVNVGMFENAAVKAGAVASNPGAVPSQAGTAGLTITTYGATTAPNGRADDIFTNGPAEGGSLLPPRANQIEFFFDKPIESVVPSEFGYYPPGSTTPLMGTGIPAGGFTPGSEFVTIEFPAYPGRRAPTGCFRSRARPRARTVSRPRSI